MLGLAIALYALSALSIVAVLCVVVALLRQSGRLKADRELASLERPADLDQYPLVSICIPVRNEARNVRPLVASLRTLDYPRFEVLVVDDGSTDGTVEAVREAADGDERIRLVPMAEIAQGDRSAFKSGKAYVLSQAAAQARGEWLLFVDADTRHRPDTLWRAMAYARRHQLPAFTSSGVYVNPGFWGELLESVLYIPVFLAIPLRRIHAPEGKGIGWMNGQFIMVERGAYERVGGHAALAQCGQDDLAMGRLLKDRGVPYHFCPDGKLFECVNYVGWDEAHRGWTRLLAAASPWLAWGRAYYALVVLLALLGGVAPFVAAGLAWSGLVPDWSPAAPLAEVTLRRLSLGAAAFALLIHTLTRGSMKLPLWRAPFLPVSALLTAAAYVGAYRIRFATGSYDLRGRTITPDDPSVLAQEPA